MTGGCLEVVDAVLVAQPPASNFERRPSWRERAAYRAEQRDTAIETIAHYNPDAVVVVGVPFGHTRLQWILPFGGEITVEGANRRVRANYG